MSPLYRPSWRIGIVSCTCATPAGKLSVPLVAPLNALRPFALLAPPPMVPYQLSRMSHDPVNDLDMSPLRRKRIFKLASLSETVYEFWSNWMVGRSARALEGSDSSNVKIPARDIDRARLMTRVPKHAHKRHAAYQPHAGTGPCRATARYHTTPEGNQPVVFQSGVPSSGLHPIFFLPRRLLGGHA